MASSASIDRQGKFIAAALNSEPTAERRLKAVYVPHLGTLVVERDQAVRRAILEENRLLYEENRIKAQILKRSDFAGGYPMQIPEFDLIQLKKLHPEARNDAPKEDRAKFYKKLYREHPEYRIG